MEDALAEHEARSGAMLVDPGRHPERRRSTTTTELEVLLYEFKADLERLPRRRSAPGAPRATLADLIAFNEANREREMPYFGQELFVQAEEKGPLDRPGVREALAKNLRLSRERRASTRCWTSTGSTRSSRRPAARPGSPTSSTATTSSAAARRRRPWPAIRSITVPAGYVFGLPVGHLVHRAARGARRGCSRSPTPTSRDQARGGRRSSRAEPRPTQRAAGRAETDKARRSGPCGATAGCCLRRRGGAGGRRSRRVPRPSGPSPRCWVQGSPRPAGSGCRRSFQASCAETVGADRQRVRARGGARTGSMRCAE